MNDLGFIALLLALIVAIYGLVVSLIGGIRRDNALSTSGRNALFATAGLVIIATVALWYLLITNDFSNEYVASHSEQNLPLFYRFSSLWGGQAGSLLFWGFILAIYSSFFIAFEWRKQQQSGPFMVAVLLIVQIFFLIISLFAANPFNRLWLMPDGSTHGALFRPDGASLFIPADGTGLNPLLQNYWMVIHPVALYLGYVGLTLPMAMAVGALMSGRLQDSWVKDVRPWILIPWIFLTAGIIMGSQWAYIELGWGGFWAWDPVENASFIPWLTGTAFLHSIMIQQQRGMLKVWNMVLAFLSFWLVIVGTFITRSGIIDSVHAFALSNVGPLFLGFTVGTFLGFLVLLWHRLPQLQSDSELDSMLSRESAFLYVNVLFVVAAFATLFGTVFPIVSEGVTNTKIAVSTPYFNKVDGPIFLALLILMAVGPLLGWRRTSPEMLRRNLTFPIAFALAVAVLLIMFATRNWLPILAWTVCAMVVGSIIWEYYRGARARRKSRGESWPVALGEVMTRNQRRYGGYIVHFGVVLIAVSVTGATAFQHNLKSSLRLNESTTLAGYTFTYTGLEQENNSNHDAMIASVLVEKGDKVIGTLTPRMNIYQAISGRDMGPTTEVGLHTNPREDVYVVFNGWEDGGQLAAFEFFVNPLMLWMWIGGLVMIFGTVFALIPIRARSARRVSVPVAAQPA
ncbi:MAG: heme lyase CcmF/NrfE family subunit [Caldilineales bacterium]|nr:heme lyase CcmF/NrfE family subunit [Caldilineales bacterium]